MRKTASWCLATLSFLMSPGCTVTRPPVKTIAVIEAKATLVEGPTVSAKVEWTW